MDSKDLSDPKFLCTANKKFPGRIRDVAEADVQGLLDAQMKYGDSWRKRGGQEAYFNVTRKIDRIELACRNWNLNIFEAIMECVASDGTIDGKDSLLDDIRDLRRYLLLVEEYMLYGRDKNKTT